MGSFFTICFQLNFEDNKNNKEKEMKITSNGNLINVSDTSESEEEI